VSSEVEGLPSAGADQRTGPVHPPRRRTLSTGLRRILRRPFRSVLQEIRASQSRSERETARTVGDLSGRLFGELAELRLAVHRLQTSLNQIEHEIGTPSPTVSSRSDATVATDWSSGPLPVGAGVNLIGDFTATTGLAQGGRRLAAGLQHRGVPLSATPVRSGAPQIDDLLPDELRDLPSGTPYPIDLVTLNLNEISALSAGDLGLGRTGRYAIGAWYWEFETLPPDLVVEVGRVDEIWAPTTFVEHALGRYTSKPIHIVPTIVPVFEARADRSRLRKQWGVADDDVMFLFSFDFNSSVVRKNPLAVVDAYRQAFGSSPAGTRLVMKAVNLANSPVFQSELRAALEGVGGVLIDEHVSQEELGDLFHAADVYVSLHRSEGFGLGLAEAMAIGKAVIGTAYSGNIDFMNGANSCLVGYVIRPITSADHRYHGAVGSVYRQGFLCAEPDVDQAARWMRALASDADLRSRIGAAASETMAARFSEAAVLETAMARLEALWRNDGASR
jgi:glycosyltransferase involved in cell wall biosynthesis